MQSLNHKTNLFAKKKKKRERNLQPESPFCQPKMKKGKKRFLSLNNKKKKKINIKDEILKPTQIKFRHQDTNP